MRFYSLILISILLFYVNANVYGQREFKARYELVEIPKVKAFHVKGQLEISENAVVFTPKDTSDYQIIKLNFRKIVSANVYPSLLKNRLLIVTETDEFSFFSYQSKQLEDLLKSKLKNEGNSIQKRTHKAYLLKRVPFLFPIVLDFTYRGILEINENDDEISFIPEVETHILKRLTFNINEITKVRAKMFWLLPRNILKIKIESRKYKFAVQDPKKLKAELKSL